MNRTPASSRSSTTRTIGTRGSENENYFNCIELDKIFTPRLREGICKCLGGARHSGAVDPFRISRSRFSGRFAKARVAQPRLFVEEQQVKLVVVLSPSTIPPGDSSLSLSSLSIQSPSSRWNVNSTRPSRAHEHALRFTLCRFTPKNTQMISL